MILEFDMVWFLGILLVCLLALFVYFMYYPLRILALFSPFFKPEKKSSKDVLAVPVKPKIRIECIFLPKTDTNSW